MQRAAGDLCACHAVRHTVGQTLKDLLAGGVHVPQCVRVDIHEWWRCV